MYVCYIYGNFDHQDTITTIPILLASIYQHYGSVMGKVDQWLICYMIPEVPDGAMAFLRRGRPHAIMELAAMLRAELVWVASRPEATNEREGFMTITNSGLSLP